MIINATLLGGEQPRSFHLSGRIGQTLFLLHRADKAGITALDSPAKRLAAYVYSLRRMGFEITTERELHDGDYPGHHARYRLQSAVMLGNQGEVAAV